MAPGDGNVYYALGSLYNKQGKYEEAIKALSTALYLKPNFAAANYEMGYAYSRLGIPEEATRQLQNLISARSPLATDLQFEINRPRMVSIDGSQGSFNLSLGANTPLWMLDPVNLMAPGSSRTFSVNIEFSTDMDPDSIALVSNWSISKAKSTAGGYYNNSLYAYSTGTDATSPSRPLSVVYNAYTMQATVTFSLSQNDAGDATIDPKHLVFKFSGMDASGRAMNNSSDEIDGYSAFEGF
jgi:tetratricopeptide (TPR) repeat protein